MFKFVILLSAVASGLGGLLENIQPSLDGRIVGGHATTIENFPFIISLRRNGSHFCGGTIINSTSILTAAHCVQGKSPSDLSIRAGSSFWESDGIVLYVASVRIHEGYDSSTHVHDIAVIFLSSPLVFSDKIQPIVLAETSPPDGTTAFAAGWGVQAYGSPFLSDQLRYVLLKIISQIICASKKYCYGDDVKKGMICAGTVGKDSCQGDSGGPLIIVGVFGYEIVGVVSWGIGCGFLCYPGVYTDIAEHWYWIVWGIY